VEVVVIIVIAVVALAIVLGSVVNARRTGESIGRYLVGRYGPDRLVRRDRRQR